MPFAVAKWPSHSDPRTSIFGGVGWAFGAVPPWTWIVSTTGASGPWAAFNAGIVCKSTFDDFNQTDWAGEDFGPSTLATVTRKSTQPPFNPPDSLELSLTAVSVALPRDAAAVQEFIYPFAVAVFDGFIMIDGATGLPDVNFPNPVKITPAIWSL